ncbi:ABC transporter ATP-binding protein [Sulfidibacter corallicola]|uniref:ABC transporter ATP-binding protein n=1 Tax=Sulfidibacter corallicola TaxID=2818388 RepID=A0A8A4TR07_SULCO|nr:ABC transporter ATP-binding protein [Sulfidibacter corallicola]QTD51624.1 ABC transporter ATP-binding protein [Sulfidibacter corallicola]
MLVIEGLEKTYDNGVRALNGISLNISKGLFGLLGPNGAGKSTLMRTIATLQTPDKGRIHFDGIDCLKQPNLLRQRLGYLPQNFGVIPRVSALELLDHLAMLKGLVQRRQRREVVDDLLAITNLYQHRKKAVSGFSGGMRQRFGIAQALLGNPDLLIVDEPTAGLDPDERNRFHNLLVGLSQEKVVILSTHLVQDVAELCSEMAVQAGGSILLKGHPKDLLEQLEGRIWQTTVEPDEVAAIEAELCVISKRLSAGQTRLHVWQASQPPGFRQVPPDLEDVYFTCLRQHDAA